MFIDKVKIIDCIERMQNTGEPIPCNEREMQFIGRMAQIFSKDEIESMTNDEVQNILKVINYFIKK